MTSANLFSQKTASKYKYGQKFCEIKPPKSFHQSCAEKGGHVREEGTLEGNWKLWDALFIKRFNFGNQISCHTLIGFGLQSKACARSGICNMAIKASDKNTFLASTKVTWWKEHFTFALISRVSVCHGTVVTHSQIKRIARKQKYLGL